MRIIPPHRPLVCQMSRTEEKILCRGTELAAWLQETRVEDADADPYHRGPRGAQGKPYGVFLCGFSSVSPCVLCGDALRSLRGRN
jgi:hypothetical protein